VSAAEELLALLTKSAEVTETKEINAKIRMLESHLKIMGVQFRALEQRFNNFVSYTAQAVQTQARLEPHGQPLETSMHEMYSRFFVPRGRTGPQAEQEMEEGEALEEEEEEEEEEEVVQDESEEDDTME
jgi:hypothetical protein